MTEGPVSIDVLIAGVKKRMQQARQSCPFFQLEQRAVDSPMPRGFETGLLPHVPLVLPELASSAQPPRVLDHAGWIVQAHNRGTGSYELIAQIREAYPERYLIARDWIVDEYQILQARMAGADALTLSNALLGVRRTQVYLGKIRFWEMEPFFEAHSLDDVRLALELKVKALILAPAPGSIHGWSLNQIESASRLLGAFSLLIYRGDDAEIQNSLTDLGIQALAAAPEIWQGPEPEQQLHALAAQLDRR